MEESGGTGECQSVVAIQRLVDGWLVEPGRFPAGELVVLGSYLY